MTVVTAILDLESLGMTLTEWKNFAKDNRWEIYTPPPRYSKHMRNMLEGWQYLTTIGSWKENEAFEKGWRDSGTYAFVYDPDDRQLHPILNDSTLIFGETIQPLYKRMMHHVGAFKGKTTNMAGKWDDFLGTDLNYIKIWFRPHRVSDPDWEFEREHSSLMETQAHATYRALWNKNTRYNTRDLPNTIQISEARKILIENNILKG